MDPVYGYQAVNVEAQLRTPTSLLRWLHRFIALRKEHPVFGLGTLRAAAAGEPARSSPTSAATRTTSSSASTTSPARRRRSSSTSREFEGWVPEEMFGRTRFPRDRRAAVPADARAARVLLVPAAGADGRDDAPCRPRRARRSIEFIARAALVRRRRRARSRTSHVVDCAALRASAPCSIALVEVRFQRGDARALPAAVGPATASSTDARSRRRRRALRASSSTLIRAGASHATRGDGTLEFRRRRRLRRLGARARRRARAARRRAVEHVGRLRRRADPQGLPPARGRAQPRARAAALPHRARLRAHRRRSRGWYAYAAGRSTRRSAILQEFVPDARDGWELALDELASRPGRVPRRGCAGSAR